MQEVRVVNYCDYPGCADDFKAHADRPELGQETFTVEFWVYVSGKGRKTNPIKVEMCELHKDGQREIFNAMQKYDQNKVVT